MPASREVRYHDKVEGLTVAIEPVQEKEIYYTDDAPQFDLIIKNETGKQVTSRKNAAIRWLLGVGPGQPSAQTHDVVDLDLEPGEHHTERIGGELLAFEGNGVVGINQGITLYGGAEADTLILKPQSPNRDRYRWLYTFTVWDKSHYEAVHEQPKRLLESSTKLTKYVLGCDDV